MTLWIVLTLLVATSCVALAVPLIQQLDTPASDSERRLKVSRDQLVEVEADQARGLLNEREAAEARLEIERRVLADAKEAAESVLNAPSDRTRLIALAMVTGWIVVAATGLYAVVGRPDLPSQKRGALMAAAPATQPAAQSAETESVNSSAPAAGSVEEMIAGLVDRLNENPDDAEGWRMLGWSYFNTERYGDAADAYKRAVDLDPSDGDVWSAYGEVLVRSARGMVTRDALGAFDKALELNPADPRAAFFKGMALEQAGNLQGAIDAWLALAGSAPDGADWLPGVLDRIEELAATAGIDLGDRLADLGRAPGLNGTGLTMPPVQPSAPGPSADDVAAAAGMSPEDRQQMIVGMVNGLAERLEDNPDDPQGWARLISSRMVLNDVDGARAALTRARKVFAGTPDKLKLVLSAATAAGLDTTE